MKIAVLVRTHHRMQDLEVGLAAIRRHWSRHDYHVLVVSNGLAAGIEVPPGVRESGAEVVELSENPGHLRGNSQLLREGLRRLPREAEHVVLLEADTWLFSDRLVDLALERMARDRAVWASATWLDRYHSVAVDFAVADARYLREHPEILDFERHPETRIASGILRHGARYVPLPELMPVHVPRFVRSVLPAQGGRFRSFPDGPMVTHHIEDLPGGLQEKLAEANYTIGAREFDVPMEKDPVRERHRRRRILALARLSPRSAWFRRPRHRE